MITDFCSLFNLSDKTPKNMIVFRILLMVLLLFNLSLVWGQVDLIEKHFSAEDSLYREDQFYLGLGINFLFNKPTNMSQSGLSGGLHFGYIRDLPLNKQRNIALGLGLGLALDTYSHNLFIGENNADQSIFDIIDADVDFSTNRFSTYSFEIPIHFRWRTSSIGNNMSFWRIYTGFNIGYLYYFKSTFEQPGNKVIQTNVEEINKIRYDFYFSFGKSKINFFFRYSLNDLFDAELIDTGNDVSIGVVKAGLVFYAL